MKKITILIISLLFSVQAWCYDFEKDGIYYIIRGTNVTVTYQNDSLYSYGGNMVIPSTVTYLGTTYTVTSIGNWAFAYGRIQSIIIPNSVTNIGDDAFHGCLSLTSVNIGSGVTSIGKGAFLACSRLISIIIPNGVTSIRDETFSYCTGLTSITIPDGVMNIGKQAFSGSAWYANQPDGIVYAGKVLYQYKGTMPTGTSINIEEGTLGIAYAAFSGCSGLTSIEIPNTIINIGDYAFSGCSGLTSITIPNRVTGIGDYTFSGCSSLTSVTIPNSVISIGGGAFWSCNNLRAIYSKPAIPPTCDGYPFSNEIENSCMLYVPNGSLNVYKNAPVWEEFLNIVEEIDIAGITLSSHAIELEINQDSALTYTITPSNATNKNINWTSRNPNIATINNGTVTAKSAGTAYIIATTEDGGYKDSCLVTVTDNTNSISDIANSSGLRIYPNPIVNGKLTIETPNPLKGAIALGKSPLGDLGVKLFDLNGKLVGTFSITGEKTEINISHLPSGTYLLKVGNVTQKVVLQQ